jgi:histidinol dehydrogenase
MKSVKNPKREDWKRLLQRPYADDAKLVEKVKGILEKQKSGGDATLAGFTKEFDDVEISQLEVSIEEINDAANHLNQELKDAIQQAASNIKEFHLLQRVTYAKYEKPGHVCWTKAIAIEKVGLYIPGGSAPLFSTVLMLGIPAKLAGCKDIILCTPAGKDGNVHPAILYAAKHAGVNRIFKAGGAQAIAAMAYGTETIPAVNKIFGPGNQYVTAAKQLLQMQGIAIDMPAGPSELCVLADDSANAAYVAADLLSQAEHGPDSHVVLITTSEVMLNTVLEEIDKQLEALPRKEIAAKAVKNGLAIYVNTFEQAIDIVNEYAAEHLILNCSNSDQVAEQVINAGSVFIGNFSPESAGDYATGTNHTLPTNGFAKAYSGVGIDSFVKKVSFQKMSRDGLYDMSKTIIAMAEAEGLEAHAAAVRIRIERNIQ